MGDVVWIRGDIELKKRVRLLAALAGVYQDLGWFAEEPAGVVGWMMHSAQHASTRLLMDQVRGWRRLGYL